MVVRRGEARALALAKELAALMSAHKLQVMSEPEFAGALAAEPLSALELARQADLILVLGGDGTLLGIARLIEDPSVPILGINLGGLGFLTEVPVAEAKPALERVLAGDYEVDHRITLEATLSGSPVKRLRALNDMVVNRHDARRMLDISVVADAQPFCSYRADGLIIATPTGSTAYALSAGGPIVFPTVGAIILAPICPHALGNRPAVLPDSFELEVRVGPGAEDARVTADSQELLEFRPRDAVRVRRADNPVALVRSTHPYFEIWRNKLHWG